MISIIFRPIIFFFFILSLPLKVKNGFGCYGKYHDGDVKPCNFPVGVCVGPDDCLCYYEGWGGDECDEYLCNEINENVPSVCSENGDCVNPNLCDCDLGFNQPWCETWSCYGIENILNETNGGPPCTGHGDCTDPDTCVCSGPWDGSECEIPICNPTCENGGFCEDPYTPCNCSQTQYSGDDCTIPTCNPICDHGTCASPNFCDCTSSRYIGEFCEIPTCIPSCIRGSCDGVDFCNCSGTGYEGTVCDEPTCELPCQHGSTCEGPNFCDCGVLPYEGVDCSIPVCSSCENGDCTSPEVCECWENWNGTSCDIPICNDCINGDCTAPLTCTCNSGWEGYSCDQISNCTPPCSYGQCNHVYNNCSCSTGWEGDRCDTAICTSACLNGGNCDSPDHCNCTHEWRGETCEIPICVEVCQNGGICDNPDSCDCGGTGYSGGVCTVPVCNPTCKNGGDCISPNLCNCTNEWEGGTCETPICNSLCEHGSCTAPNNCTCPENTWEGDLCEIPICVQGCLSGNCTLPGECTCEEYWDGISCEIPICFGYKADHSSVCSSNGDCIGANDCQCNETVGGDDCSLPRCYGLTDEEGACSGDSGICENTDVCFCNNQWLLPNCTFCDSDYSGVDCDLPICHGESDPLIACSGPGWGNCSRPNHCVCESDVYGDECKEKLYDAKFVQRNKKKITMIYITKEDNLESQMKDEYGFACDDIIADSESIGPTATCRFLMDQQDTHTRLLEIYINDDYDLDVYNVKRVLIDLLTTDEFPAIDVADYVSTSEDDDNDNDTGGSSVAGIVVGTIFGTIGFCILCLCCFCLGICCVVMFNVIIISREKTLNNRHTIKIDSKMERQIQEIEFDNLF